MDRFDKIQGPPSSHGGSLFAWTRPVLLVVLGPLLWLQGRYVRRVTPRLPEPGGARSGSAGQGPALRLLIAGDSAAAGVGAASQAEALSGQLVQQLARHFCVQWELWATTGHTSEDVMLRLQQAPAQSFDAVVLSVGVNDVTALQPPRLWVAQQAALATELQQRFAPRLVIHSAVPPMHAFAALPQPLRWFLGRWAVAMNLQLGLALQGHPWRALHTLPPMPPMPPGASSDLADHAVQALASDGFHPGPAAYAVWGEGLAQQITQRLLLKI